MAMERFDDDLNIIAGLGDDPKRDDGLSTPQFKSVFDRAGLLIQDFINNKLIPFIEKQNVGLPIGGGTMEGPINMNGQRLRGLNAPTEDDEPATKGYADNLKPNLTGYATETFVSNAITDRTVNNFTTTEEGFVADARALKVLQDSKLAMELLWENASPTSSFAAQTISLDLSEYDFVRVVAKTHDNANNFYVSEAKVGTNGSINGGVVFEDNGAINYWLARKVIVSDTGVQFYTGGYSYGGIGTPDRGAGDSYCIPIEIYGIKGGVS